MDFNKYDVELALDDGISVIKFHNVMVDVFPNCAWTRIIEENGTCHVFSYAHLVGMKMVPAKVL